MTLSGFEHTHTSLIFRYGSYLIGKKLLKWRAFLLMRFQDAVLHQKGENADSDKMHVRCRWRAGWNLLSIMTV